MPDVVSARWLASVSPPLGPRGVSVKSPKACQPGLPSPTKEHSDCLVSRSVGSMIAVCFVRVLVTYRCDRGDHQGSDENARLHGLRTE
jgi:hypothetical protein